MRLLVIAGLLATVSAASAQSTSPGFRGRIALGIGSNFTDASGKQVHLQGPEIALDLDVATIGKIKIAFEPSILGGGRVLKGFSATGDVYRFTLVGYDKIGTSGYLKAGFGMAQASARKGSFSSESGWVGQLGGGIPLKIQSMERYSPAAEVNLYLSDTSQLRSFSIGIGIGF